MQMQMQPQQQQRLYNEASYFSRPGLYGGFGVVSKPAASAKFFSRGQRQRLNVVSICQCLLCPWLFFCVMNACMSFGLHYHRPGLTYGVLAVGLLVVLAISGVALRGIVQKRRHSDAPEPSWYIFLAITMAVAWILGVVLGGLNFNVNMQPYFDYANLNTYSQVDTAQMRGQQVMDAGKIDFVNGTTLDLRRSMGFKNMDTYCVAPITMRNQPLASYDFWAVGLGCCSGNTADFHCGEYNNPQVQSGLRLLRDDQRPFFRLAVQQAEATYSIKATHPLFFYWVQDPVVEIDAIRDEGYKYFLISMLAHFGWQLLCVVLAMVGFAGVGHF